MEYFLDFSAKMSDFSVTKQNYLGLSQQPHIPEIDSAGQPKPSEHLTSTHHDDASAREGAGKTSLTASRPGLWSRS